MDSILFGQQHLTAYSEPLARSFVFTAFIMSGTLRLLTPLASASANSWRRLSAWVRMYADNSPAVSNETKSPLAKSASPSAINARSVRNRCSRSSAARPSCSISASSAYLPDAIWLSMDRRSSSDRDIETASLLIGSTRYQTPGRTLANPEQNSNNHSAAGALRTTTPRSSSSRAFLRRSSASVASRCRLHIWA